MNIAEHQPVKPEEAVAATQGRPDPIPEVPGAFSPERIAISEQVLSELIPVMNEIHAVNYGYRFWKIVMGDYVNALVSIKYIFEREELLSPPLLTPLNSHHYPTLRQRLIARLPSIIKHFRFMGSRARLFAQLRSEKQISVELPDIEAVRQDAGPLMPLHYPLYIGAGNREKRNRANKMAEKSPSLFRRNMIRQIPRVYVEYFDRLYDTIPLTDPAQKTFHAHGILHFYSSIVIAKYLNHGAKLYCYQHGAYYGEMKGHNAHYFESSVADQFRSWGWKIRENDVPWKAYRLEKFKQSYAQYPRTGEYDFLMCFPDVYDANLPFFKKVTDYFLREIDSNRYSKIMARPRPINKMFSHAKRLFFINDPRVTIDSGLGPMAEVISKCRLVIQFTVPATNFMECLYVNHPTMGLLDNDQPTDQVKPYYDFLLERGVLHRDFESLVRQLNRINLDEWWSSLQQEPLYLQFKNEFLRPV